MARRRRRGQPEVPADDEATRSAPAVEAVPERTQPIAPPEESLRPPATPADVGPGAPVLRAGAATDTGRVRQINQDAPLVVDDLLFAVADGMGGHKGGEVASTVAVAALRANLVDLTLDGLVEAAGAANDAVLDAARDDPDLAGMGTTLVAVARTEGDDVALVNVGDSRIYRFHDGELEQLTTDHSLVEELVREGRLTPEEARVHPQRNIVTRALGIEPRIAIDAQLLDVEVGDRLLLCSDGLFNEVDDQRIASILRRLAEPTDAARELVRLANEGGGRDNITVVVVDVLDPDDEAVAPVAATGAVPVADDPAGFATAPESDGEGSERDEATTAMPAIGELRGRRTEAKGTRAPLPEPLTRAERRRARKADREAEKAARAARPRRFTWRVALFFLVVLAVLGAGAAGIGIYARGTYFVGVDAAGEVTIFQGKPDPVLWFEPTVERPTGLALTDIAAANRTDVEAGAEFATLTEAEAFLDRVGPQDEPTTTTTTTTPTTGAPPTTAPVPAPTTAVPPAAPPG